MSELVSQGLGGVIGVLAFSILRRIWEPSAGPGWATILAFYMVSGVGFGVPAVAFGIVLGAALGTGGALLEQPPSRAS